MNQQDHAPRAAGGGEDASDPACRCCCRRGGSRGAVATVTLPPVGSLFRITGTTGVTSLTASWSGREATLRFAGRLTVTDGSNLRLPSTLSATEDDTITLVCDGTNWYEVGRSVN